MDQHLHDQRHHQPAEVAGHPDDRPCRAGGGAGEALGDGEDDRQGGQQDEAHHGDHGGAGAEQGDRAEGDAADAPISTARRMKRRSASRRARSGGNTAQPMIPATIIPTSSAPALCSETPEG